MTLLFFQSELIVRDRRVVKNRRIPLLFLMAFVNRVVLPKSKS